MSSDADCGAGGGDEEELTGAELRALVAADPGSYELVNRGPCGCCWCCPGIPDAIQVTVSDVAGPCAGCVPWPVGVPIPMTRFPDALNFQTAYFPAPCYAGAGEIGSRIGLGCNLNNLGNPLRGMDPFHELDRVSTVYTPVSVSCDPFLVIVDVEMTAFLPPNWCPASPGFGVAATMRWTFEPLAPAARKWWCVETGSAPFRECQQGVTEAVGGPYATEADCLADCGAADVYCWYNAETRDFACGSSSPGDGYVQVDGPFEAGDCPANCPPCRGSPAPDPGDDGCGDGVPGYEGGGYGGGGGFESLLVEVLE